MNVNAAGQRNGENRGTCLPNTSRADNKSTKLSIAIDSTGTSHTAADSSENRSTDPH